jgi:hypothetical protein
LLLSLLLLFSFFGRRKKEKGKTWRLSSRSIFCVILTWGRSECGIGGVASIDHVTAPKCHSNRSSMSTSSSADPNLHISWVLFSVQIL